MANNTSISAYNLTLPVSPSTAPLPKDFQVIGVIFALVSFVAFFGNLFAVLLLLKHRSLLKKPYYNFIFLWSVVDLLTAVLIPVSPDFVIAKSNYPYPSGLGAQLFCRLIDTDYFLFAFGKASLLAAACMAIDRWCAVIKPLFYQRAFNGRKISIYMASICCLSVLLPLYKLTRYSYDEDASNGKYKCSKRSTLNGNAEKVWRTTYITVTVILPCLVTWIAFIHIWKRTRKSSGLTQNARRNVIRVQLLRLASVTAILMTFCWLPAEVSYMLRLFKVPNCSTCFKVTKVLAFANSAVNPFLYYAFNSLFRQEVNKMMSYMKCWETRSNRRLNHQEHYELSKVAGSLVNYINRFSLSEDLPAFSNVALEVSNSNSKLNVTVKQ